MGKAVVLVIRKPDTFSHLLKDDGLEVVNLPLIHTEPVNDFAEFNETLEALDRYDGIFFTSPAAAAVFIDRAGQAGDFKAKIYAHGGRTMNCFEGTGFDIVTSPGANTAEEFIKSFNEREFVGKRFLFVRGDKSLRTIPWLLRKCAVVDEVIVYRTIEDGVSDESRSHFKSGIDVGRFDWKCFFSPSAVDAFVHLFGADAGKIGKTAVIGNTTANRAAEAGMSVRLISPRANAADFAKSLIELVKQID